MNYEQALEVNGCRANGNVDNQHKGGIPQVEHSKGGRYWLQGEFCLNELEALLVIAREQMSFPEPRYRVWNEIGIFNCTVVDHDNDDAIVCMVDDRERAKLVADALNYQHERNSLS